MTPYDGRFDSLIDTPTDESLKNMYAVQLLANREHYQEVLNIMEKFDLTVFKKFSQPHFKSISFEDNDSFSNFALVLQYLEEREDKSLEFVISEKETDSKQCYFVLLVKGI